MENCSSVLVAMYRTLPYIWRYGATEHSDCTCTAIRLRTLELVKIQEATVLLKKLADWIQNHKAGFSLPEIAQI